MSIATKTGDYGTTALMYNRRVPKCHPRVESYGSVDELSASLGMARALIPDAPIAGRLLGIQKELMLIMAELATAKEDMDRFTKDGLQRLTSSQTEGLDAWVEELEQSGIAPRGWSMPGANPPSAALEVARVTCRRAERRVCSLLDSGDLGNSEIIRYLNRLSDLLWLLARFAESIGARTIS